MGFPTNVLRRHFLIIGIAIIFGFFLVDFHEEPLFLPLVVISVLLMLGLSVLIQILGALKAILFYLGANNSKNKSSHEMRKRTEHVWVDDSK